MPFSESCKHKVFFFSNLANLEVSKFFEIRSIYFSGSGKLNDFVTFSEFSKPRVFYGFRGPSNLENSACLEVSKFSEFGSLKR